MTVVRGTAYGRRFELRLPDGVGADVAEHLPPGWRPTDAEPERVWELVAADGGYRGFAGGELVVGWPEPVSAMQQLVGDLVLWVAAHARRYVFLHAGCVAVGGRAIVLPGRSLAGKSTLTAALVRAGATYYSDEYAVLGADGRVRPYARHLAIRGKHGGFGVPTHVSEFGGAAGTRPASVGLVAVLQFSPCDGWSVEPLSRAKTAVALLDNAVAAKTRTAAVMTAIDAAMATARGVQGTRGEAADAAQRLLALLAE